MSAINSELEMGFERLRLLRQVHEGRRIHAPLMSTSTWRGAAVVLLRQMLLEDTATKDLPLDCTPSGENPCEIPSDKTSEAPFPAAAAVPGLREPSEHLAQVLGAPGSGRDRLRGQHRGLASGDPIQPGAPPLRLAGLLRSSFRSLEWQRQVPLGPTNRKRLERTLQDWAVGFSLSHASMQPDRGKTFAHQAVEERPQLYCSLPRWAYLSRSSSIISSRSRASF